MISQREAVTAAIETAGVVAVIRMQDPDRLRAVIDALADGGVRALEITMTVPGAIDLIHGLSSTLSGDFLLGAGTVLDAQTAARVIDAGAQLRRQSGSEAGDHRRLPSQRRGRVAGLLLADRDPDRVGVRRRHREGLPGNGTGTIVLHGRTRAASPAEADADRRGHTRQRG